jgi:hypothetical protein
MQVELFVIQTWSQRRENWIIAKIIPSTVTTIEVSPLPAVLNECPLWVSVLAHLLI